MYRLLGVTRGHVDRAGNDRGPASGNPRSRNLLHHEFRSRDDGENLDHEHVMETGAKATEVFSELVRRVVSRMN